MLVTYNSILIITALLPNLNATAPKNLLWKLEQRCSICADTVSISVSCCWTYISNQPVEKYSIVAYVTMYVCTYFWLGFFILLRQGTNGGQGANLSYWVDKSIFRAFFVFKDEKNYVFYFLHKTLHFNFVVRIVWFLNWWMTDDNWLWKLHCLAVNCVSPPHFEASYLMGLPFDHPNISSWKAKRLLFWLY